MLKSKFFRSLEKRFGPFDLDACADDEGLNAHLSVFCSPKNSFLDFDASGCKVFMNPPYGRVREFLTHYFDCKDTDPKRTRGVFVLPEWENSDWYEEFLPRLRRVKLFPKRSKLFTRPSRDDPSKRINAGPTPWAVGVYTDIDPNSSTKDFLHCVAHVSKASGEPLLMVSGEVQGQTLTFLVDSGASRDFIGEHVNLPTTPIDPLRVKLANGDMIVTKSGVSSKISLGNDKIESWADMARIPLGTCDAILGQPWLRRHNPKIDWVNQEITLPQGTLRGSTKQRSPSVQLVSSAGLAKELRRGRHTEVFLATVKDLAEEDEACTEDEGDDSRFETYVKNTTNKELRDLLKEFRDLFRKPVGLPPTRPWDHEILLEEGVSPPARKCYRMSPEELKEVRRQLNELLDNGWVRPSNSPFGAPILFVRKKDGSLRMCIDYRELNRQTRKNKYPLPRVDEMFDLLFGARYFSSLDLYSGYHQLRIKEGDEYKTAFKTRYGLFEFTVMPFGLTNAPASFMGMMNELLKDFIDKYVLVYLDDVLVYSTTEREHLVHLRSVFEKFAENGLKLQIAKCHFMLTLLTFLGHQISDKGLRPDPSKVKAVTDWPMPRTLTEIRAFLGFVNFYRRFIPNFSHIAAPLTNLTKTTSPRCGEMTPAAEKAFLVLKEKITSAPTLVIPYTGGDAEFTIVTDASGYAIGMALHQDQGHGLQPVAFEARKLNKHEQNYPVQERELLAVVEALRVFRCYVEGCNKVTVVTDHDSLTTFLTHKDLRGRKARWAEVLAPYAPYLHIDYKPGRVNCADPLSRRPDFAGSLLLHGPTLTNPLYEVEEGDMSGEYGNYFACGLSTISSPIMEEVIKLYGIDPMYQEGGKLPPFITKSNNVYWCQDRLCIPNSKDLKMRLLQEAHDSPISAHGGVFKTLKKLTTHYWWPKMRKEVKEYVESCPICQRIKSPRHLPYGKLHSLPTPSQPWEIVSMDLVTDLPPSGGYNTVLIFVCLLTKQAIFIPTTKEAKSEDLASLFFEYVFRYHGLPKALVSDRDSKFTSGFWRHLFSLLDTSLNLSTSFHPQTDGQSERVNQVMQTMLRATVDKYAEWSTKLPYIEFAYNSSISTSTGYSPFYANKGFNPRSPLSLHAPSSSPPSIKERVTRLKDVIRDVQSALDKAHKEQERQANKRRIDHNFKVGDLVRVNARNLRLKGQVCGKLKDRFVGPFRIVEKKTPVSFRLDLPPELEKLHPIFHVDLLEPFKEDKLYGRSPGGVPTLDKEEYKVQRLVDVDLDTRGTTLMFKVRWDVPYDSPCEDTWVPLRNVERTVALEDFLRSAEWAQFSTSRAFRRFADKYPGRIPQAEDGL